MRGILGTVTIGQSPRVDLLPEMARLLGDQIEIREAGALDDLCPAEIARLAPATDDYVLVSRLRDGGSVRMSKRLVLPLVQEKIADLFRSGARAVVLLCTGEFPPIKTPGLLVLPQPLVYGVVGALARNSRLGVLCPDPEQIAQTTRSWQPGCAEVVVQTASPYTAGEGLAEAARRLQSAQVDLIVMDCMGYNMAMQELVRSITQVPVLLARSLVARILAELLV